MKRMFTCKQFSWNIHQHAGTDGHRLAMGVFQGVASHLSQGALLPNYDSRITDPKPYAEIIANTSVTANLNAQPRVLEKSLVVTGMPQLWIYFVVECRRSRIGWMFGQTAAQQLVFRDGVLILSFAACRRFIFSDHVGRLSRFE